MFSWCKSKFKNFSPISDFIKLDDGHKLPVLGIGNVEITLSHGDKQNSVLLKNCAYAPNMAFTLISIICIASAGESVNFKGNFCTILHPDKTIIAKITHSDGLYHVCKCDCNNTQWQNSAVCRCHMETSLIIWGPLSSRSYPLDLKSTLIMQMRSSVRCVQQENQPQNHSWRNLRLMKTTSEKESIGTYGDLWV